MEGKVCTKCKEEKPLKEFSKDSRRKNGKQSKCKACEKKYREENREKVKASQKRAYEKNKEHYQDYKKQWREENIERLTEERKERYHANREENIEKTKEWREANPKKYREMLKSWRENNKDKIVKWRENNREHIREYDRKHRVLHLEHYRERARNYSKTEKGRAILYKGKMKRRSQKHKVAFTPFERLQILNRDKWTCQNCGAKIHDNKVNDEKKAHIDHILPIAEGGNSEPSNLQILCRTCNLRKGKKIRLQLALDI